MSHAKESQQGKETKKKEGEKDDLGNLESRGSQRRDKTRSRDGLSEERERKERRRSSESRIAKYEREKPLEKDKTRHHKEREKKDKNQATKVTYVTGRKRSTRSEHTKDLESTHETFVAESRIKTSMDEDSTRWDDKKKETVEGLPNMRKRDPSSSSSSSNSSDWEAPWERMEGAGKKKRIT